MCVCLLAVENGRFIDILSPLVLMRFQCILSAARCSLNRLFIERAGRCVYNVPVEGMRAHSHTLDARSCASQTPLQL